MSEKYTCCIGLHGRPCNEYATKGSWFCVVCYEEYHEICLSTKDAITNKLARYNKNVKEALHG